MSGELLAHDELTQLADCERIIEDGYTTFLKVGLALAKVRDAKLYRADHKTFEAYCEKRWSMTRTRAYQLISSAALTGALSTMVDIPVPANERQARELQGLDESTAAAVMAEAVDEDGVITAASIAEAREQIAPKPAKVTHRTTESETVDYTSPGSGAPVRESAPPVEPATEPGAHELMSAAIERYPALNIEKATDADILKVADALDKLTDDTQLDERIENGRRWLVAKSEGRLGGSTPLDPCQSGDEITEYCIEAATDIRGAGGADAFAAAWESADNLTRDNWRASLYSLETVLNDLRSVTQAKQLRSV